MSIAASGLSASSAQFAASAVKVVQDSSAANTADGNLAADVVGEDMAADSFRANIAVMRSADKMMGTLLDIMS